MRDCVALALESSPRIKAAEDAVLKAEAEIGMARAGFLPQLTAFATRKSIQGLSTSGYSDSDYDDQTVQTQGLQLSQTLFAGLSIFNGYQRAVLAHQYALAEKEDALARLTLEVQSTFLDRLRAEEQAKIYTAHLESLETNGRALRAMFAQHMVSYSDVLDVETEIADARQKLSEAQNEVSVKTIELKGLLHIPFENNARFVANTWDVAYMPDLRLEQIREHALKNQPAVRLARLAVSVVKKDRDTALGAFAPRLSLSLSYNKIDMDYEKAGSSLYGDYDRDYVKEYAIGMLSLEWDLFEGGKDYYQVRSLNHEISRLNNNLKDQESMTYTEVEKAFSSFMEARKRSEHAFSFLKSARENLAMTQARLEKSLGTLPELVLARSKLQNAESSLVTTQIDCQQALANLYYAMGRRTLSLVQ